MTLYFRFKYEELLVFPIFKKLILSFFKIPSTSDFAWKTKPKLSLNNNLIESFSLKTSKSILAPILLFEKHISSKVVINPPELISWPELIILSFIKFWKTLKVLLKYSESDASIVEDPIQFIDWLNADPPKLKLLFERFI